VPDQNPAQELRAAAQALQDPNADACQMLGCWHPDELHQADADGLAWCKDCMDQHPHMASRAAQVPQWLRQPLTRWLDSLTGIEVFEHGPMAEEYRHALAVARALLGGAQ